MKRSHFTALLQSVRDAGAYLKGKRVPGVRLHRIDPDSVMAVRARLKVSQSRSAVEGKLSTDG